MAIFIVKVVATVQVAAVLVAAATIVVVLGAANDERCSHGANPACTTTRPEDSFVIKKYISRRAQRGACDAQGAIVGACIPDQTCADCLNEAYKALPKTVTCGEFVDGLCPAITTTCASICGFCQDEIEAFYSCVLEVGSDGACFDFFDCSAPPPPPVPAPAPTDSPVSTPPESPIEPTDSPVSAPTESSIEPTDSPVSAPTESPGETSRQAGIQVKHTVFGIAIDFVGVEALSLGDRNSFETLTESWYRAFFEDNSKRRMLQSGVSFVSDMTTDIAVKGQEILLTDSENAPTSVNRITYDQTIEYTSLVLTTDPDLHFTFPFLNQEANTEYGMLLAANIKAFRLVALPISIPELPKNGEGATLSTADVVGVSVGAAVAIAVLGFFAFRFFRRKSSGTPSSDAEASSGQLDALSSRPSPSSATKSQAKHRLPTFKDQARDGPSELQAADSDVGQSTPMAIAIPMEDAAAAFD